MKRYVDVIPIALGAAVFLSVGQADADTVALGTDYFATIPETFFTLPTGIVVPLTGNPIGPGNADTIVQRTQDVTIVGSGQMGPTVTGLQMTALSLVSTNPVPGLGTVFITLDPANLALDTGTMTIFGSATGGT